MNISRVVRFAAVAAVGSVFGAASLVAAVPASAAPVVASAYGLSVALDGSAVGIPLLSANADDGAVSVSGPGSQSSNPAAGTPVSIAGLAEVSAGIATTNATDDISGNRASATVAGAGVTLLGANVLTSGTATATATCDAGVAPTGTASVENLTLLGTPETLDAATPTVSVSAPLGGDYTGVDLAVHVSRVQTATATGATSEALVATLSLNGTLLGVPIVNVDIGHVTLAAATCQAGAPVPVTVSGVDPSSGTTAGGTTVGVSGAGFVPGATTVSICGVTIPANAVSVSASGDYLTFTTPPCAAGGATITVTSVGGTSTGLPYTYSAAVGTGSITGTVTLAPGGTAGAHVDVQVVALTGDADAQYLPVVQTDAAGNYSVGGLPAGRYRVHFSVDPSAAASETNSSVWLAAVPFKDSSTVVNVTTGTIGSQNVELPVGTTISGRLTATAPGTIDDDTVSALLYNTNTDTYEPDSTVTATAAADGTYTLANVSEGARYAIRAQDADPTPSLATTYYGNTPTVDASTRVATTALPSTGVNITLGAYAGPDNGRIAGPDRYGTASEVADTFYGGTTGSTVYVASGENFPDALSASAAAASDGAPVLLVGQGSIPAVTSQRLTALAPSRIVVVGGPDAISPAVYNQLAAHVANASEISRLAGADRFATSRAVARTDFPTAHTVFIATGTNFPDALVAGNAAGADGGPVILVNGSASSLDAATQTLLTSMHPQRIYIAGGPNAISAGIQSQLTALNVPEVLRVDGADRFTTADAVNTEVFPFADAAYIATGANFPDALSISAVAGIDHAPAFLSAQTCLFAPSAAEMTTEGVNHRVLVGGTAVLSDGVLTGSTCPTT